MNAPPEHQAQAVIAAPQHADAETRRSALSQLVAEYVANGYRVESQMEYQAVMVRGRRPNHLLHLILSLLTLGLWALFVWLPIALFGGEKRQIVSVDESGVPSARKLVR